MPWQGADADKAPLFHLGRDGGDAAQPLPLPVGLSPARLFRPVWARAAGYDRPFMSFFAVLFALLLEQLKPLPRGNVVHDGADGLDALDRRATSMPARHHAWVVWCDHRAGRRRAAWRWVYYVAHQYSTRCSALGILDVAVLYLTLGFRQFSHYFTDIRDALERGDETRRGELLAEWRHLDASELPRTELLRHVIEHSLLAAHRHVFGVFFWFVAAVDLRVRPGRRGALPHGRVRQPLLVLSQRCAGVAVNERLMGCRSACSTWLDHVPARLTAFGFAVVGNFEEAVNCWRRDASLWCARQRGRDPGGGGGCGRRAAGRRLGAGPDTRAPRPSITQGDALA
jgi:adenosylcobinamide-phosphate synthase